MELVRVTFNERLLDIESYFELVDNIEKAIGTGEASFNVNNAPYRITPEQQKIMYSGIYLHLYNLIESTISLLINAVERHTTSGINGKLISLSENMRKLYVKSVTAPSEALSNEKRLEKALNLFNQVLQLQPLDLKIPPGGGGNWDVSEITKLNESIGVKVKLPKGLNTKVKRPFRDDKGPIRLIKDIRNKLAHGSLSFTECGDNHVASEFRKLIDIVKEYLEFLIDCYENFILHGGYRQAVGN
ncbi:MAE_28990/MAE_18760 family HEPN-like nuclease [Shewanella chilikensis]|uniref:MAE_28990/MAE_18760 family HEPN-like nuclease n=1 Tax=Shewanella chilikensis TaxID=558541 RepID=UPI00399AA966